MNMSSSSAFAVSKASLLRSARLWLIAGLAAAATLPAFAQTSGQDPSGRVGRVSLVEGQVWIKDAVGNEQVSGMVNWPVASGTALETGMTSRVEVRVGSSTYRLAPDTKAQFIELSDHTMRMNVEHGSVALRFKDNERARESWVVTQSGVINFSEAGRYRVDVDYDRTSFAVSQGQAQMNTQTNSFGLRSGGRMEVSARGDTRNTERFSDSFDDWVYALDRRDDSRPAPRYVSREMTGYDTLDDNGYWNDVQGYGAVWYPRAVAVDWAPYRYGHWTNLQPWGWTWVDEAPWGFAVSHYGRWGWIGGRWGWVPGAIVPRPVWAPALVAWGGGSGWSMSVNFGSPIAYGWVPLGPAEVYVPWYAVSPRYCESINRTHVTNVTIINNYYRNPGQQSFANVHVAGAVSAAAAGAAFAGRTVGSTLGTTSGSMARAAAAAQQGGPVTNGRNIIAVRDVAAATAAFNQHRIVSPTMATQTNAAPVPIRVTATPAVAPNAPNTAVIGGGVAGMAGAAAANAARGVNAPPVQQGMPPSGQPLNGAVAPQRDPRDPRAAQDARAAAQQQQQQLQMQRQQQQAQQQPQQVPGREWRGADPRMVQQPQVQQQPQGNVIAPQQVAPRAPQPVPHEPQAAAREAARQQHEAQQQPREAPARREPQPQRGDKADREEQVIRRLQER